MKTIIYFIFNVLLIFEHLLIKSNIPKYKTMLIVRAFKTYIIRIINQTQIIIIINFIINNIIKRPKIKVSFNNNLD